MKGHLFTGFLLFCATSFVVAQDLPKQINGGILNGKAMSLPKPDYPESARSAGLEGTVKVTVVIDEAGSVVSAVASDEPQKITSDTGETIEVPVPDMLLRDAAERAAWNAKFSPTLLRGNPVRVTGRIVYNFRANGVPVEGMPADSAVLNGKAILLPKPAYPPAAIAVGAGGTVSVQVTIDEEGNVVSAAAVSGHPLLRASAVSAARKAKFSPPTDGGKPVSVSGVVVYNFVPPEPKVQ